MSWLKSSVFAFATIAACGGGTVARSTTSTDSTAQSPNGTQTHSVVAETRQQNADGTQIIDHNETSQTVVPGSVRPQQ